MVYYKMNSQTIVCCVVALILGMLLANMLKNVCGCKNVVEGQHGTHHLEPRTTHQQSNSCPEYGPREACDKLDYCVWRHNRCRVRDVGHAMPDRILPQTHICQNRMYPTTKRTITDGTPCSSTVTDEAPLGWECAEKSQQPPGVQCLQL
jgi:hypothetical protein